LGNLFTRTAFSTQPGVAPETLGATPGTHARQRITLKMVASITGRQPIQQFNFPKFLAKILKEEQFSGTAHQLAIGINQLKSEYGTRRSLS
jgi:hypothetical protein